MPTPRHDQQECLANGKISRPARFAGETPGIQGYERNQEANDGARLRLYLR